MRSSLLAAALVLATVVAGPVFASERGQPYSDADFKAAQKAGEPILVDVTASWCPTCKRQGEVLSGLFEQGRFEDLTVFEVNYDDQKEAVRAFRAPRQSTLVVYRGEEETGRAVAITTEDDIAELIETAYSE